MGFLRNIYYLLPPVTRRLARRIWFMPGDLADRITGKRDPMIPPRGRIFIGSGDFQKTGEMLRDQLVDLAGLKPYHRVLDVGCGMGRLAVMIATGQHLIPKMVCALNATMWRSTQTVTVNH